MARKKRSQETLRNVSNHLLYEIWMLESLAQAMASGVFGQGVLNNAVLESFTLHTRILLDFLYAKEAPRSDDVIAEDFFQDPEQWKSVRPEKSETLNMIHTRVGKEVAHLTYARLKVTPEAKQWPFLQIANELRAVFNKFLEIVPKELLA
jgi:hypothetical protein